MRLTPMLASPSKIGLRDFPDGWTFEPKYDGFRCLAHGGRLWSREGNDVTDKWPEIPNVWPYVLDGEIIVYDPDTGAPSFNLVQRRTAKNARSSPPAYFMVFDILGREQYEAPSQYNLGDGYDCRRDSLASRRALLNEVVDENICHPHVMTVPHSTDALSMYDTSITFGHEGIMAKRLNAPYYGGRSDSWLKIKQKRTITAAVVGEELGTGKFAHTMGALLLALRVADPKPDQPPVVRIGKVGTGFTHADRDLMHAMCQQRDEKGRPIPFAVELEYQEFTAPSDEFPIGKLRFPSFVGPRVDISPINCTTAQLEGILL